MRLKVSPHDIEHLDQQRVPHGIKNLIAFFAAGDDPFRAKNRKVLRGVGLFEPESLDDGSSRQLPVP